MNKLEVSIKFKDNLNKISFNLNKNNVFYGNNGKGKTRVLKTIELLYGLAKTLDYNSLISQLIYQNLQLMELIILNYFLNMMKIPKKIKKYLNHSLSKIKA